MSKNLLIKLQQKKKVYRMWGKGRASLKKYRNVVRVWRDVTKKGKIHLECKMAREVKDNQKHLFNCISKKGNTRENVSPLLNEVGVLVTECLPSLSLYH